MMTEAENNLERKPQQTINNSPQIHFLAINLVLVKVQQVHCARHSFVPILLALHHTAIVQQTLQQPRHGSDKRLARLPPHWVIRLNSFQQTESSNEKPHFVVN